MVNLLIGVPLESFLAIALLSSRRTIAPMYSLSSTHAGAGVLWVLSELLTVVAVIPIYFQWMASEDRKTAREDARLDAEGDPSDTERHPWLSGAAKDVRAAGTISGIARPDQVHSSMAQLQRDGSKSRLPKAIVVETDTEVAMKRTRF